MAGGRAGVGAITTHKSNVIIMQEGGGGGGGDWVNVNRSDPKAAAAAERSETRSLIIT